MVSYGVLILAIIISLMLGCGIGLLISALLVLLAATDGDEGSEDDIE